MTHSSSDFPVFTLVFWSTYIAVRKRRKKMDDKVGAEGATENRRALLGFRV
jgi:hypothetical protein